MTYRTTMLLRAAVIGLAATGALVLPAAATAQATRLSLPAMPLDQALRRIEAWSGKPLNIDPDAVKGRTSAPVTEARNADDALRQATRGAPVVRLRSDDGTVTVANDIVVVARRDEGEDNILVRGPTTSSRLGQTLREEARNTQVISGKLLEQQQARTLVEALKNSAGVVASTGNVQGGVNFTVRGFTTNGSTNGLPSSSSSTFAAGATQSLANVERIEVLSGPDAILLGADSIGGSINIVTRKPSADTLLKISAETGSFGEVRGTIDANNAISDDKRLSARIIATAASADRNFGGYRGNEDYLFAPSLRYKNSQTDIILSASIGNQIFGLIPYTIFNLTTRKPFDLPYDRPLLGGKDQFAQIGQSQFNLEVTQDVTNWLTLVARGQYQESSFRQSQYSPYAVLASDGTLLVSSSGVRQQATTKTVDTYARLRFKTGPLTHRLVVGYTHFDSEVEAQNAQNGSFRPYNFLTNQPPLAPLATTYAFGFSTDGKQDGLYAQYLLGVWKLRFSAAVRNNRSVDATKLPDRQLAGQKTNVTTPNFGAVFLVDDNISLFGTLAYGFRPTFTIDRLGNRLPNIKSRNIEGGVKWDLFDKKVLLNASYFRINESNLLVPDPVNTRFQIAAPGQLGEGIDINLSGEPIKGLTLSSSYTRTNYKFLTSVPSLGDTVQGQSRDVYTLFSSYQYKFTDKKSAGLSLSMNGNSSSFVDRQGLYVVPAAFEMHANAFMTLDKLDFNIGVRNLLDRQNYFRTFGTAYLPLGAPRTWRLTMSYRFQ